MALEARSPHLDAQSLEVLLVLEVSDAARGGQQRLGGHAATVDAGAANVVTFNNSDLEALCNNNSGWYVGRSPHEGLHMKATGMIRSGAKERRPGRTCVCYLLHCMQSCSMASYAASNDDKVIVILVSGRLSDNGLTGTTGTTPDHVPSANTWWFELLVDRCR